MKTSDWITIGGIAAGLFFTTIGSALFLSFKIGGMNERVISLEKGVGGLDSRLDRMELGMNGMKLEIKEIQVKLDILWRQYLPPSNSSLSLKKADLYALKKSNIEKFMDDHYTEILSKVKLLNLRMLTRHRRY